MKYLILVLSLVFYSYSYGQSQIPDLIIPINFTFQFAPPTIMQVGLDSTATDCLDPQIGESELPPIPPPGWEALIELPYPECQNSFGYPIAVHKDFRFGELPFTGTKTHKFLFRQELGATIHWNLPNGVTGLLQDVITGGNIINYPMAGQDSFYVQYNYIDEINMILYYDNVTPVELTSFTALFLQNEKAVQLNWSTATETNNSGFVVERMSIPNSKSEFRNSNWTEIGFVPGFGTTTEPKSYSFTDENISTGTYKYRLKQIDYDGSFTYSDKIEVVVNFTPKEFVLYQNFPNPFNPSTTIKYSLPVESLVRINIYNALGEIIEELVSKSQSSGNYEVTWNAQNYSSGIYYYSFEVNSADGSQSHREMKKIVFLK